MAREASIISAQTDSGFAVPAGFTDAGVDVIIRIHDSALLKDMSRALFSLYHQSHRWVRPVIVTQGFAEDDLTKVVQTAEIYDWTARPVGPQIINVPNPDRRDIRATLLNRGLQNCRGRYVAFLDADDYMYSHAYSWLIQSVMKRSSTIAFGNIINKQVAVFDGVPYTFGRNANAYKGTTFDHLMVENFCPIHSFIVDRHRVEPGDLRFDESLCRLEDYDFLLRICSRYSAEFSGRNKAIGVYNWKSDGSNCTVTAGDTLQEMASKNIPWEDARDHISRLKRSIRSTMAAI